MDSKKMTRRDRMKKMCKALFIMLVAAVFVFMGSQSTKAADVSAELDVASSYVFRGVTVNDNEVAQGSLEISNLGVALLAPVTLGLWANYDLEASSAGGGSGQISEIDISASYALPFGGPSTDLALGFTEYTYPTDGADSDRDLSLVASLNNILPELSPQVAIIRGVEGALDDVTWIQLSGSKDHALNADVTLNLAGTLSYRLDDRDLGGDDGLDYGLISAGLSYGAFIARADFYLETDDDINELDEDFVGVIGISTSL